MELLGSIGTTTKLLSGLLETNSFVTPFALAPKELLPKKLAKPAELSRFEISKVAERFFVTLIPPPKLKTE